MAIDRTGISSLETGAPEITYTGAEGPKSPDQQLMASADPILVEEYNKYVFELKEIRPEATPMSFKEFVQQVMSGMAEGGIARLGYKDGYSVQGGVKNYLGNQETVSGVPVKCQSGPDKPDTELAYITKAEKDLLLKEDIHGSLKDGPNMGPGGIMSLDSFGDIGGGGQSGAQADSDRAEDRAAGDFSGVRAGSGSYESRIMSPSDVKAEEQRLETITRKQEKDMPEKTSFIDTVKDKAKSFAHEQRKKGLLRNMFHVAKGRPIQPALMAMLQGGMTEEEFEEQFGVSIDGLVGLSPMEQTNIFGDMSQFDKDRLGEMAETYGKDYISQSDFENAFYGPKGPPDLTGGGNGQGITSQYPYPYPMSTAMAPATGTPTLPVLPPVQTANPFLPGSSLPFSTYGTAAHGAQFGVDPRMFAADGGRIGYADGDYVGSKHNVTLKDEYDSYLKEGGTMSFSSFVKMLREDRAQGGRIGYDNGGSASDRYDYKDKEYQKILCSSQ